jgi:hypothetical protein
MASKIQFKRGTTTQSDAYRGAEGEVIINTTKDTIVVHDGVETGGYEIIRADLSNLDANVPAVNITDVDCGIYGSGLFSPPTFTSASLSHTLDNPNDSGSSASDNFGYSVATSDTYSIVGAYVESNASGKAYIFNNSTGALVHTLDNPNAYGTSSGDLFGYRVAISDTYAIVGAFEEDDADGNSSSKAYIFNVSTGAVVHTLDNPNPYGTSANDYFGRAVAITDTYAIVGAVGEDEADNSGSGKAYIFNNSTGALVHTLDNPNDYDTSASDAFGGSVAISDTYSIVGAQYEDDAGGTSSGKAYIFNNSTGALVHTLDNPNAYGTSASDNFGRAVAITDTYALVGAIYEDDAGGNSSGKAYIFNVSTGALVHTLDNPNAYGTSSGDYFGGFVAMSDNYALVGAQFEADAGGTSSGKAYIFSNHTGALLKTLDNPNDYGTSQNDRFGEAVGITDTYVIVGAFQEDDSGGNDSGKSYIYEIEQEPGNEITAPGAPTIGTASVVDHETVTVAFTAPSDDGYATIETYTATSSPGGITGTLSQAGSGTITVTGLSGSTSYTFTVTATNSYNTGDPSSASNTVTPPAAAFLRTLDNPNDYGTSLDDTFGDAVAISDTYSIVGAYREDDAGGNSSGKAYIFNNSTGALVHTLDNPNDYSTSVGDNFGVSVGISGNYAIVGSYNEDDAGGNSSGKAYIFNVSTGALVHTLDNPNDYGTSLGDFFGSKVAISDTYSIVTATSEDDAGGDNSGKAYIYTNSTGALLHTLDNPSSYGTSAGDLFGTAVAITDTYAIVGTNNEDDAGGSASGKAYIFTVSTGALLRTIDNPNDYDTSAGDGFAGSVGISGNYAIVGAYGEDDAGGNGSGKAYIFNVSTGALLHTLDNPNPYGTSADDQFGSKVSISGNYAIVSALQEDDAGGSNSGKAYIYNVSTGALLQTIDNPNAYGTSAGDLFGIQVAISGDYAIVTAREADAGGTTSGKAYMYSV